MRSVVRILGVAAVIAATMSCGDVVRQGRAPAYLVINSLAGARGNTPTTFGSQLISDVIVILTQPAPCSPERPCPTVFGDLGEAVLSAALKDVGTPSVPATASPSNAITITRYHVAYRRADGRNTPGVDIPYAFDGAATATVFPGASTTIGFQLVRLVAKQESPLVQLINSAAVITALADVTFYGRDQVGNEVSVTGTIEVMFGNFGDTTS